MSTNRRAPLKELSYSEHLLTISESHKKPTKDVCLRRLLLEAGVISHRIGNIMVIHSVYLVFLNSIESLTQFTAKKTTRSAPAGTLIRMMVGIPATFSTALGSLLMIKLNTPRRL